MPHIEHFDDNTNLPFLIFIINESIFFVFFFVAVFCTLNNKSACLFYNTNGHFLLCFCFINFELSDKHSLHLDLSLITLFVIAAFPVCFLQAKQ